MAKGLGRRHAQTIHAAKYFETLQAIESRWNKNCPL